MTGTSVQHYLQQAYALLSQGQAPKALEVLSQTLQAYPRNADAFHLAALCYKSLGNNDQTEKSFKTALAYSPNNVQIHCNYANYLSTMGSLDGAIQKYQYALRLDNKFTPCWSGLGSTALNAGLFSVAEDAYLNITKLQPNNSLGWHGLGSSLRAQDKLFDAEKAFKQAVSCDPNNAAAWINLAVVQRFLGNLAGATSCLNHAKQAGFNGPELLDAQASVALDAGDTEECLELYKTIIRNTPQYLPAYDALARITYEHQPEEDAAEILQQALIKNPNNTKLTYDLIRLLFEMNRHDEALALLDKEMHKSPSPSLQAAKASALEKMGNLEEAITLFEAAISQLPENGKVRLDFVRTLIRAGHLDHADQHVKKAIDLDPNHQLAWAYQGDVWRLMGNSEREEWLHGYDGVLVKQLEIHPPSGYASISDFLKALKEALLPLHKADKEPVNQSLQKGSQTSGNLFGFDNRIIQDLKSSIQHATLKYIEDLPEDPSHPLLSRKSDMIRFAGAWSVKLGSQGHHINHVHSRGWLSSAFYVDLPPIVNEDHHGHQGWIQFGQPPSEIELPLSPRKLIMPKEGTFALFPSYTWHGTIPFNSTDDRLTVAYDIVPG
ncbi:tetratricopeptide repeat-containing 2OG-Fe(II) oxygenase [Kordiimonas sediminis]|uniref:Tetratricopeptide repeat-containing 2OG-Fe(II) oxygenase n=1 Tax=Kordiimonas sediminis TaxID=1735581 RepID=A0A919ASK0_9PROT|nr:tetratricopeptide repeat protein [Kordiimonas sediminis]GHF22673.1 tetratricopeptide repeat-containing 2OG-Fe(II) oxygenase [Kordiimonas sediminis]